MGGSKMFVYKRYVILQLHALGVIFLCTHSKYSHVNKEASTFTVLPSLVAAELSLPASSDTNRLESISKATGLIMLVQFFAINESTTDNSLIFLFCVN